MPVEDRATTSRRRTVAWSAAAALTAALTAVALVVVLALIGGEDTATALGYGDVGTATSVTAAVLRLLADLSGAVCAGSLVYAAFFTASFTASAPDRGLSAPGWAAARLAGWAAWTWAAAAVALIPFDTARATGLPVARVLSPRVLAGLAEAQYEPR